MLFKIIITDTFNIQLFAKDKLRNNISQFHNYYQKFIILHNSVYWTEFISKLYGKKIVIIQSYS